MFAFCSTTSIATARLVDLLDDLEAPLDENWRQPHGGLVHQEQLRMRRQGPAHRDHLLLAAGEGAGELVAALVQHRAIPRATR